MKKINKIIFILILGIVFAGCETEVTTTSSEESEDVVVDYSEYQKAIETPENFSESGNLYYGIMKGKAIYARMGVDQDGLPFYKYDLSNHQIDEGWVIPDFQMSMYYMAADDEYIYQFILCNSEEDTGNYKGTTLYRMNTQTNEVDKIDHSLDTISGYNICVCNNKIISLAKQTTDMWTKVFIETYNPDSKEWRQIREYDPQNGEPNIKEDIIDICSNGEEIFAYCKSSETNKAQVEVIDTDGELRRIIEVSSETDAYITSNFIRDMKIYGDYIYMLNGNMYSVIMKIKNSELVEIRRDRYMLADPIYSGKKPVFFRADLESDKNYIIEINNDEVKEYYIPIANDTGEYRYRFNYGVTDDKQCCVICHKSEEKNRVYLINREDFGKVYISIE